MWLSVQDQTLSEIWGVAMAIPIVGKKFPFVLHSNIILQNDDYEETYNPKGGKNISFWRCKTYFLSHLLFVKHQMCAQIVMSCIFCRFRYIFISQPAIIILNAISPKCNNQHNKELRHISRFLCKIPISSILYCDVTSLLLNSTTNVSWSVSKIQNLPMLLTYISYIIYV